MTEGITRVPVPVPPRCPLGLPEVKTWGVPLALGGVSNGWTSTAAQALRYCVAHIL